MEDYGTTRVKQRAFHISKRSFGGSNVESPLKVKRHSKLSNNPGRFTESCYKFPLRKTNHSVLPPILGFDDEANNQRISLRKNGKIVAYAVKTSCGIYRYILLLIY
jgi:hypothetical protein